MIKKTKNTAAYRRVASRLKRLLGEGQVIEGSLSRVTAGSAAHWHLTRKVNGRTQTLYVPMSSASSGGGGTRTAPTRCGRCSTRASSPGSPRAAASPRRRCGRRCSSWRSSSSASRRCRASRSARSGCGVSTSWPEKQRGTASRPPCRYDASPAACGGKGETCLNSPPLRSLRLCVRQSTPATGRVPPQIWNL